MTKLARKQKSLIDQFTEWSRHVARRCLQEFTRGWPRQLVVGAPQALESLGSHAPAFGPWATTLDADTSAGLSTFWKKRMAMLPVAAKGSRLSRRAAWSLLVSGCVVVAVPTLVSGDDAPELPTATAAPVNPVASAVAQEQSQPEAIPVNAGGIIARVGGEVIREREVDEYVDAIISRIPIEKRPKDISNVKYRLKRDCVNHFVEIKLVAIDAKDQLAQEVYSRVTKALNHEFESKEISKLLVLQVF